MRAKVRLASGGVARAVAVGIFTAAVCYPSAGLSAKSLVYYAQGQAYPLERSQTELAIELRAGESPAVAGARLGVLGLGTVETWPWGSGAARHLALLHVARADERTQARVLAEGNVLAVHSVYRFRPAGLPHVGTGRILAKFDAGVSADQAEALLRSHGLHVVDRLGVSKSLWLLEPRGAAADEVELAARLHEDPRVRFAHPDLISPQFLAQAGGKQGPLSSEPLAELQWHLQNAGQEGGVFGADISFLEAYQAGARGSGIVLGMLDDACDVFHEDLVGNYVNMSQDAVSGEESPTAANPLNAADRHGTAMMGLMCAQVNDIGIVGVAPLARFTASRGAGDGLTSGQVASAFDFALARNVDVHCNSWTGESGAPTADAISSAIEDAFQNGRDGMGLVMVFPTGNGGEELQADGSYGGLASEDGHKMVIGVGASNAADRVTSYSDYGVGVVDVLAPSGDTGFQQIVTTDNTDESFPTAPGYNNGGVDDFGLSNLSDPNYTEGDSFSAPTAGDFFGTSAACAQVAGVAALTLSSTSGPELTATQVRAVLQHTADRIPLVDPEVGNYNTITGRSLKYGYGRVNANEAVKAARLVTQSSPYTWPEPVRNVQVTGSGATRVLSWEKNDDLRLNAEEETRGDETTNVLVVQRVGLDFEWAPSDGSIYFEGNMVDTTQQVTVAQVGDNTSFEFDDSLGIVYFGIFARNEAGRYSFGYSINSEGEVIEAGRTPNAGLSDNENGNDNTSAFPEPGSPVVTISVQPLSGISPLTVSFRGNAPESDSPIVDAFWDFGDGSPAVHDTVAEHTYTLVGSTTTVHTATLTMIDADGDEGQRNAIIRVFPSEEALEESGSSGAIRIIVSEAGQLPNDIGGNATVGQLLELTVDTSHIVGTPESVFWSLGDGTSGGSFIVSHSYTIAGTFPIIATVDARTTSGDLVPFTASRLFTVEPLADGNTNTNVNGNANTGNDNSTTPSNGETTAAPCGVGMILPLFVGLGLTLLRRFRLAS